MHIIFRLFAPVSFVTRLMILKRLALACTGLLLVVGGSLAAGWLPMQARHWLLPFLISGAGFGLVGLALLGRRTSGAAAPAPLEPPPWATTRSGATPDSIARLEALARDNQQLQQQLLAHSEQLKQMTEGVKQRREAQQARKLAV